MLSNYPDGVSERDIDSHFGWQDYECRCCGHTVKEDNADKDYDDLCVDCGKAARKEYLGADGEAQPSPSFKAFKADDVNFGMFGL